MCRTCRQELVEVRRCQIPPGLELQAIVSHHVDTGTQSRILGRSEVLLNIDQPPPEPFFLTLVLMERWQVLN